MGIYCYLAAGISYTEIYRNVPWVVLYETWILSKLLNLIGCHGNQKDKFAKKILKPSPQKP